MSLTVNATTEQVKIGNFQIEGLMFDDGKFGISIPQLNELISFSASNNVASRDLKRLLGNNFSPSKVKIEGFKQLINAILLSDVETLLFELSISGNKKAQEISRSLIGLSLTQLFADAFNQKFEKEERQAFLKARQEGKMVRRQLTDSIQDFMNQNEVSKNYKQWIWVNVSDKVNVGLFGMKAKKLKESRNANPDAPTRDYLSHQELKSIEYIEQYAMKLIDKNNVEPKEAIEKAIEFFN